VLSLRALGHRFADALRCRSGFKRRIVGIALRCAAKEGRATRFVHRRARLQAFDEIRIGQDHLVVGFQIGHSRSQVSADLVAWTTGPVHDQRLLPQRAQVGQEMLVAVVRDVDASSALFGSWSHTSVSRAVGEFHGRRPVLFAATDAAVLALPVEGLDRQRLAEFMAFCPPASARSREGELGARGTGQRGSRFPAASSRPRRTTSSRRSIRRRCR
jgi:hypothetical protein